MLGFNGGLIGKDRSTAFAGSVPGIWTPGEQVKAQRSGLWPIVGVDPYFANVSLLLHGDGTNGSTTFTDSSSNNHAITVNGNAQISTTQSKFGGASMYFDGNGDYLTLASSDFGAMGTGDFTIEWWEYIAAFPSGYFPILSYGKLGSTGSFQADLSIRYENSGSFMRVSYSNGSKSDFSTGLTSTTNTWRHCALVRSSGVLRLYQDGVALSTTHTSTQNITNSGGSSIIGGSYFGSGGGTLYSLNGYIDDLRITKGVARYTANFTPPTAAFPDV